MTISLSEAKPLLRKDETSIVEASYPPSLDQLSAARLRQKAQRARRLEDKYRDLTRGQRRSAKGAGERGGAARTEQKARLFGEVRERYEARLAQLPA